MCPTPQAISSHGPSMTRASAPLTYDRTGSAVFRKTSEGWGGLSNMAGGFPIRVNGLRILTSEALYQACRYPHRPDLQRLIIDQKSPMAAKMKSKPHRTTDSRPDWHMIEADVMRWCLQVKLKQNWSRFEPLLRATGERSIVEESHRDDFWGAIAVKNDTQHLIGRNVLGRLLMELRSEIHDRRRTIDTPIEPLPITGFLLEGVPISCL